MSKFIYKVVNICFTILAVLIVASIISATAMVISEGVIGWAIAIVLFAIVCCFIYFGNDIFQNLIPIKHKLFDNISFAKLAIVLLVFCLVSKVGFVLLLGIDSTIHPDMEMYHSFANQLATKGFVSENASYAVQHNYTFIYGAFLSIFARMFGSSSIALTIGLSILISIANVLLFDVLRKFVDKGSAFCGLMVYNILPMGLFQTQLLVHETGLLFFHILALWFLVKVFDNEKPAWVRIICLILGAYSICFGSKMNKSGIIIMVSFIIYSFVKVIGKKITIKKIAKFVCIALVFAVAYTSVGMACDKYSENHIDYTVVEKSNVKGIPFGWGLYVGFHYDSDGQIYDGAAEKYYAFRAMDNQDDANKYQKDLLMAQFDEYKQSPIKLPKLFFNKIKVLYGTPWLPFSYEQGNKNCDFIYRGFGGLIYKAMLLFNMLAFMLIYCMMAFSYRRKDDVKIDPSLHCKMSVFGITTVLMFIEVTPKYASHLQILLFVVWILGMKGFMNNSLDIKSKFSLKKHKKQEIKNDTI